MTEWFSGETVGGPYDGRKMVHYRKIIYVKLIGPEFDWMDAGKEDFEVEVKEGQYHFKDGRWLWQTSSEH